MARSYQLVLLLYRLAHRFALSIFLTVVVATNALADKRAALVFGISNYQNVPRLTNPDNDAVAMSDVFKQVGFEVVELRLDLGVHEMRRAVREFAVIAADADIAIVYYAGHGMEVDGVNYLVPADAKLLSDFDVEDEAVSLDRILQAINPAKRLRLVILDACRDNPFSKSMKRSIGTTRSVGRGLAKIDPTTADTLIAFAAKAGSVASDGDGPHSPFSTALFRHIATPGLDLRIALGRVRDEVLKSTDRRQEPFVYGSLGGETVALVPQVTPPVDPNAAARIDYELAAQVATKEAWDSFLQAHPVGLYADLARAQKSKLLEAEQARARADEILSKAEQLAAQKADEFRKQLEEQSVRQNAEAKQKLTEQAKRELDEDRRKLAEQAKKELEQAKQQAQLSQLQVVAAHAQVEEIRREAAAEAQAQIEKAKRDAKQDTDRLAALAPTQPAQVEAHLPQLEPNDIARLLQAHLKRVGCNPGNTDGNWDESSQRALDLFNKSAQTKFDAKVASLDALDAVRGKPDRVCPLICGKGQRAEGDHCIQIGCGLGYFLNSIGACEKQPKPSPKPSAASARDFSSRVRPSGGGGKCFIFGGKTYCE